MSFAIIWLQGVIRAVLDGNDCLVVMVITLSAAPGIFYLMAAVCMPRTALPSPHTDCLHLPLQATGGGKSLCYQVSALQLT